MIKQNQILADQSIQEGRIVHQPAICVTSAKMVEHKRDGPVYDRLYNISKNKLHKNIQKLIGDTPEASINLTGEATEKENTFNPLINPRSEAIVRDRPVQDLLYDDAMRRQEAA